MGCFYGGDTYTLYELNPYGYAVLYDRTNGLIEACYEEGVDSPIDISESDPYYYAGPMTFCKIIDGEMCDVNTGDVFTLDDVVSISETMRESQEYEINKMQILSFSSVSVDQNNSVSTISVSTTKLNNYFSNLTKLGNNKYGTCTVIAISMALGYYDNYVDDRFVDTKYRDWNGTNEDFHIYLIKSVLVKRHLISIIRMESMNKFLPDGHIKYLIL